MSNAPCGRQLWSPEEDEKLREIVLGSSPVVWTEIATKFLNRTGKQCRERWVNHLNPGINGSDWLPEEDQQLFLLRLRIGNKWASIAKFMPGRSENAIKNRWYSSIAKRSLCDPTSGIQFLRNPISRGRAKKNPDLAEASALQRIQFSSVPLVFTAPSMIGQTNIISPKNDESLLGFQSSVPIPVFESSLSIPNGSLMAPRFQMTQSNSSTTIEKTKNSTKSLSVTSLMNPNFPTKPKQPTIILHSSRAPTNPGPT